MKTILHISIIWGLVLFLLSCTSENDNEIKAELQVHFNKFVEEASAHGMDISLANIDIGGYIYNIEQQGTLGQCKTYANGSKQIVIDQSYWNSVDLMEKEYLVFHELGHCVLGREHKDIKDASGICLSIMQSGNGECTGIYNTQNREGLLDELFE